MIKVEKIGADIELFVYNTDEQRVVSAEGHVKGTKYRPYRFDDNEYFSTSLDNVLAEFTIPPSITDSEFIKNIDKAVNYIQNTLPNNLVVLPTPCAVLDIDQIMTANAMRFGCEVDYNAYSLSPNESPFSDNIGLRSAGGHIHIGIEKPKSFRKATYNPHNDEDRVMIIRAMDLFVGLPLSVIEPDNERKTLYGKAGAYRPKPYGVEYRTPSNYYITSKELTKLVFNNTRKAITFLNKNSNVFNDEEFIYKVAQAINENDNTLAKEIMFEMGVNY